MRAVNRQRGHRPGDSLSSSLSNLKIAISNFQLVTEYFNIIFTNSQCRVAGAKRSKSTRCVALYNSRPYLFFCLHEPLAPASGGGRSIVIVVQKNRTTSITDGTVWPRVRCCMTTLLTQGVTLKEDAQKKA